jgi:hypothetical protein
MWDELTDKIMERISPMISNGTASDPLQLFAAISDVLREFNKNRIARIYERSTKRVLDKLSTEKSPQDLSSGTPTK